MTEESGIQGQGQQAAPNPSMEYDVIVVGGGPGGSTASVLLSRKGFKVLLLDKARFPRDKTCGDGLSGKTAKQLQKLGLIPEIEANPSAKMTGVMFSAPNGRILDVPVPEGSGVDGGYCCRRLVYDNILFQNAKKQENVTVMEGFTVTDLLREGNQVTGVVGARLDAKETLSFKAKVVVGADGAHSFVAKKIGALDLDPRHTIIAIRSYYEGVTGMKDRIELHFVPEVMPGYFWIFPLEGGKANVGLGLVMSDFQKKNFKLDEKMFEIIKNNPLFKERFKDAKLIQGTLKGWTLPVGSKFRKMHDDGVLLVGDSAALIDPISGEGIGNAMVSAEVAAGVIEKAFLAGDFTKNTLKEYEETVKNLLGHELQISYKLQKTLNHPWLLNYLMWKAEKSKRLQHYISMSLVKAEAKQEFNDPLFYLKMLFM